MATAKAVWGIDVGQCALKALKLRSVDGQLQVEAFDVIEHPRMLRHGDADRSQFIQNALEQFLARNSVAGSRIAVAVPGRSSFTRFVKLPPVEPKKVPDIVRFEAEQQIPFPIDEVTWRWQAFQSPDSPDVEVGLFAMKRVDIDLALEHFNSVELEVDVVQMAPLALYNFMVRDGQTSSQGATLLADVGADKTDLVVADGSRIWTRTIQIGGRNFTEALEKAFKLSFQKAEKLKRTAATNKYARQVFQAMRPVFADLVQEIQRSIGYYTSLHRETRFTQVIGLGNGFRLPGLQKFLEQNIGVPVTRVDSYNCITPSATVNVPVFTENVLSFGVAYGLALQGLGEAPVSTNLLPEQISRHRLWRRKRSWFAAAAGVLMLVLVAMLYREIADQSVWENESQLNQADQIVKQVSERKNEYRRYDKGSEQQRRQMQWYVDLFRYRDFWPSLQAMVSDSIRHVARDQSKMADVSLLTKIPRSKRRIVIVRNLTTQYMADVTRPVAVGPAAGGAAGRTEAPTLARGLGGGRGRTAHATPPRVKAARAYRGFKLRLDARTPLSQEQALTGIISPMIQRSQVITEGKPFSIVGSPRWGFSKDSQGSRTSGGGRRRTGLIGRPAAPAAGNNSPNTGMRTRPGSDGAADTAEAPPANPDPFIPTEDMSNDTRFWVEWVIAIECEQTPAKPGASGAGRRP